jgi:hypothetical protein
LHSKEKAMSELDELAVAIRKRAQEVRSARAVRRAWIGARAGAVGIDLFLLFFVHVASLAVYDAVRQLPPAWTRGVDEVVITYGAPVLYTSTEVFTGYSLGKLALGLQIALPDGSDARRRRLLVRWLIKYAFFLLVALAQALHAAVYSLLRLGAFSNWSDLWLVNDVLYVIEIGAICAAVLTFFGMFGACLPARRALHDWLSGTAVYVERDLLRDRPPAGHAFEVQKPKATVDGPQA